MISANRSLQRTRARYEFFAHRHSICGHVIVIAMFAIFVTNVAISKERYPTYAPCLNIVTYKNEEYSVSHLGEKFVRETLLDKIININWRMQRAQRNRNPLISRVSYK